MINISLINMFLLILSCVVISSIVLTDWVLFRVIGWIAVPENTKRTLSIIYSIVIGILALLCAILTIS